MKRGASDAVRVLAPCKINPTLVVIERRADGFHELDLTYLALDLCDQVELRPVAGRAGVLRLVGPLRSDDIPTDSTNLARRATAAVLEIARADGLCGGGEDFDLELFKYVPSQAGLGGGSSDAAAAAFGAATALGIAPDDARIVRALAALGSDCAFFLNARETGHGRGRGRGERIEPLPAPRPDFHVALLTPAIAAATPAIYAALGELGSAAPRRARGSSASHAWAAARTLDERRAALVNDLERAALRAFPELARWRDLLDESGCAHFRLAGSGSSFFGLFAEETSARASVRALAVLAAARGLGARTQWVARAANHGVRVVND